MSTPMRFARMATLATALLFAALSEESHGRSPKPDPSWPKLQCAPLEQLQQEIQYCNDNRKAVAHAEECMKKLADAWSEASLELKQLQASDLSGQRADFNRSGSKYRNTIDRMAYLTGRLMRSADLISRYPDVMVDNPARQSREDSFPCYQQNFAKIQKIVIDLDQRSKEGVQALVAASALEESVIARSGKIESDTLVKPVNAGAAEERMPASLGAKKPADRPSDITGTEKKKEKL